MTVSNEQFFFIVPEGNGYRIVTEIPAGAATGEVKTWVVHGSHRVVAPQGNLTGMQVIRFKEELTTKEGFTVVESSPDNN
jgi:hypothetical protein